MNPFFKTLTLLAASSIAVTDADCGEISFARQVQPILAQHCYECHGADENSREGGLRLDIRSDALEAGDSYGPAIMPGEPMTSSLVERIIARDPDERMPPPNKPAVSEAERKILEQWIAQGAKYATHWAFAVPEQTDLQTNQHPIDELVQRKLKQVGVSPSPKAAPDVLCRRIYLDVIGLPPSVAQARQFVQAYKNDPVAAVDELLDQLLTSSRYGEKWARHWLDVARYSDSNGYEKDKPREQWAYRDWVIRAFNADQPYDQFLIDQLAGDLLPEATQDQVIATGFLRNSMINEEGAIIPEEFRLEEMFDRMDCLGKAAFGLSLQCARCHTHKFDPLTHDEYFGLFSFFNNTYEAKSWVYTQPQLKKIAQLKQQIAQQEAKLKQQIPDWQTQLNQWTTSIRDQQVDWEPIVAEELGSTSGLNHPTQEPDLSIMTLGHPTTGNPDIWLTATPDLQGVTGLRLEALAHQDLAFGGPGRSKYGTFAVSELTVQYRDPASTDKKWQSLELKNATADFSENDGPLEAEWRANFDKNGVRKRGPVAYMIDGDQNTAWRADRGVGLRNQDCVAVVQFAEPLDLPAGTEIKVRLLMRHGGDDNGIHSTMLGCCRMSLTKANDPQALPIDYAAVRAAQIEPENRSAEQDATLFTAWRKTVPAAKPINDQIAKLWNQYPEAETSVLHLADRRPDQQRETRLLERGEWNQPQHVVPPHTPAFLPELNSETTPNRLDLARWIVDERSPLTSRVAVNRVWQQLFGIGLVQTPEDFGFRAPVPVHLDLLNWLAVEFTQRGWSHKQLLRLIITSETYQQDSRLTPELRERDPNNQLLARGPRFRLDAEVIRDSALHLAGLLHHEIGGPSIYPPVPQAVLNYNYVKPTYWDVPTDENRYRRAIYLFRKRSMPDPSLCTLDSPNSDMSIASRERSNTPLSALVNLNETIFVEAAQGLARRVFREINADDEQRIEYAFRLCTGREIRPAEKATLLTLLRDQQQRLASGNLKAGEIAFNDVMSLQDLPANASPNDLAAWTILCRVLLNLDETMTKS